MAIGCLKRPPMRRGHRTNEGAGSIHCRRLAAEEGLLVGISKGLNVAAAIDIAA
jgi:cysteine synthase